MSKYKLGWQTYHLILWGFPPKSSLLSRIPTCTLGPRLLHLRDRGNLFSTLHQWIALMAKVSPSTQFIETLIAPMYWVLPGRVLYILLAYEGVSPIVIPISQTWT